jgi:hypothetical protein
MHGTHVDVAADYENGALATRWARLPRVRIEVIR